MSLLLKYVSKMAWDICTDTQTGFRYLSVVYSHIPSWTSIFLCKAVAPTPGAQGPRPVADAEAGGSLLSRWSDMPYLVPLPCALMRLPRASSEADVGPSFMRCHGSVSVGARAAGMTPHPRPSWVVNPLPVPKALQGRDAGILVCPSAQGGHSRSGSREEVCGQEWGFLSGHYW